MSVTLAVALSAETADRHITAEVRDLSFRSVAPGGFASCTVSLDRPLTLRPPELEQFARLVVSDTRSGEIVWEGRLEDPGRGSGSDGEVWQLVAIGPSGHVSDQTAPIIYVDRDLSRWYRTDNATPGATAEVGREVVDPTEGSFEAITFQFPAGLPIVANSRVVMRYRALMDTGQTVSRVDYQWTAGSTTTQIHVQTVVRVGGATSGWQMPRSETLNTAGSGPVGKVAPTHFTATHTTVDVRLNSTTASGTVANDLHWVSFYGLYVQGSRVTATGGVATAATIHTLFADEVVADLLGRVLTGFDGTATGAVSTAGTYGIDQLAYPDGTTAGDVLNDLMALEPGFYWAAWERVTPTGGYRFEWSPWPTDVRYEADVVDGYDSSGSASEVFNAVTIRWKDHRGWIRTSRRTSTVQSLSDAGITREGFIDLGDQLGSTANADRVGDQFLVEHAFPPNAGTLTVARPILDATAGRMVQPWELRPGALVRVRGVQPQVDSLNPLTRDGLTVMRVVSVDYNAASNVAVLGLDSYSRSEAAAIARLKPVTRRRR